MKLDDSQKQFLLQEHNQIREELMWDIKQISETERYAIIISGLIWAWLVTQQWNLSLIIAACIPALVTKMLQYKRNSLSDAIYSLAKYIYKVEDQFQPKNSSEETLGWEHREKIKPFRSWSRTYWALLFWGNILIAIIYLVTQLIQAKITVF
jgi:hypothetical protein